MKKGILYLLLAISFSQSLANTEKRIESKTTAVTVFLNGAQVTRETSVNLSKGKNTIIIEKLTPVLIKESIQVKGRGDFTILSVNNRLAYHEKKKDREAQELKDWIKREAEIENQLEEINTLINIINDQYSLFSENKSIKNTTEGLQADQLKAMLDLHTSSIKEAKLELLDYNRKKRKLNEELTLLKNQIKAAQMIEEEVSSEVHLVIDAKQATKATFEISYLIANARWFPSYDIRVDDISKPLKIVYKANISQTSGEDWEDVKLTLSTSNPNKNAQKPKVQPWYINLNQNNNSQHYSSQRSFKTQSKFAKVHGQIRDRVTGEPIPFATIQVNGSTIGTTSDFDGFYELTLPPTAQQLTVSFIGYQNQTININNQKMDILLQEEVNQLQEVVVTSNKLSMLDAESRTVSYESVQVAGVSSSTRVRGFRINQNNKGPRKVITPIKITPIQNVVNKEFKVDVPITIPSDMQSYHVEIEQIETKATYEHYCAPKIEPEVFLTAYITDWEKYDLMEGQANVYFEDTYIGNTLLDVGYLSDTLNLSLGRDKGVVVKRTKVKDVSKRQLLGSNKIDNRTFEIEIRNTKGQEINLVIEDQFPISTNSKIEITQKEKSGGKVDEPTGIITWDLKLKPKTNEKLKLSYQVKYPQENWIGLE